jgi:hypothetical protein
MKQQARQLAVALWQFHTLVCVVSHPFLLLSALMDKGSMMQKVLPSSGVLCTSMRPPCCSTILFEM